HQRVLGRITFSQATALRERRRLTGPVFLTDLFAHHGGLAERGDRMRIAEAMRIAVIDVGLSFVFVSELVVGLRSPWSLWYAHGAIRARCGLRGPTNNLRELVPLYMNNPG